MAPAANSQMIALREEYASTTVQGAARPPAGIALTGGRKRPKIKVLSTGSDLPIVLKTDDRIPGIPHLQAESQQEGPRFSDVFH